MALVANVRLAVRAVRTKLRLLSAYDTFWPAALRGGRLLLRGRVGTFTHKLFNELPDARDAEPVRPCSSPGTFSAWAGTTTSS